MTLPYEALPFCPSPWQNGKASLKNLAKAPQHPTWGRLRSSESHRYKSKASRRTGTALGRIKIHLLPNLFNYQHKTGLCWFVCLYLFFRLTKTTMLGIPGVFNNFLWWPGCPVAMSFRSRLSSKSWATASSELPEVVRSNTGIWPSKKKRASPQKDPTD